MTMIRLPVGIDRRLPFLFLTITALLFVITIVVLNYRPSAIYIAPYGATVLLVSLLLALLVMNLWDRLTPAEEDDQDR